MTDDTNQPDNIGFFSGENNTWDCEPLANNDPVDATYINTTECAQYDNGTSYKI